MRGKGRSRKTHEEAVMVSKEERMLVWATAVAGEIVRF